MGLIEGTAAKMLTRPNAGLGPSKEAPDIPGETALGQTPRMR